MTASLRGKYVGWAQDMWGSSWNEKGELWGSDAGWYTLACPTCSSWLLEINNRWDDSFQTANGYIVIISVGMEPLLSHSWAIVELGNEFKLVCIHIYTVCDWKQSQMNGRIMDWTDESRPRRGRTKDCLLNGSVLNFIRLNKIKGQIAPSIIIIVGSFESNYTTSCYCPTSNQWATIVCIEPLTTADYITYPSISLYIYIYISYPSIISKYIHISYIYRISIISSIYRIHISYPSIIHLSLYIVSIYHIYLSLYIVSIYHIHLSLYIVSIYHIYLSLYIVSISYPSIDYISSI